MKIVLMLVAAASVVGSAAKPVKPTAPSLLGKWTFAIPQRVIVQDTAKANAIKGANPILAMAGFKLQFLGLGEVQIDTYKSGPSLEGEISFTSLQMPGLMGPIDRKTTVTAKLENLRIASDTLWFLFSSQSSSEPSKGFLASVSGKIVLGVPVSKAYGIPCKEKLPGFVQMNEKFYVTSMTEPEYPIKKAKLTEFRSCLESLTDGTEDVRRWKSEISDAKRVIDSLLL